MKPTSRKKPSCHVVMFPSLAEVPEPAVRREGFTFIEVVFCLAIFVLGFTAMAIMLPVGAVMQREIEQRADAAIVGANSLAVVKGKGISNLTLEWVERLGGNGTYSGGEQTFWYWGNMPGSVLPINALSHILSRTSNFTDMEQLSNPAHHPGVMTGGAGTFPYPMWAGSGPNFNNAYKGLGASMSNAGATMNAFFDTNGNGGTLGQGGNRNYGYGFYYTQGLLSCAGGYYNGWTGPYALCDDGRYADGIALNYNRPWGNYDLIGGDFTRWDGGRIHCYKNRPIPGVTPGYFEMGDFSSPSCVFDVSRRKYFSHIQYVNRSTTYQGTEPFISADNNDWRMIALTTIKPEDGNWPEQVECDVTLPDQTVGAAEPTMHRGGAWFNGSAWVSDRTVPSPHWRLSNTGVNFRSQSTGGGNPADPNIARRGWCGCFNYRQKDWGGSSLSMAVPWWDLTSGGANYLYGGTVKDQNGVYPTPVPMDVLAIVYDKAQNLILLRYPQCFAKQPVADKNGVYLAGQYPGDTLSANPRLDPAEFPQGANWVDRRMKVGDIFLTCTGGYKLQVKAVLDEVEAGLRLPASRGGPMDWSDGTYQLVQVTPSLSDTTLVDNTNHSIAWYNSLNSTSANYLYRVIVGTPPVGGGDDPLASILEGRGGGNTAGGYVIPSKDMVN